MKIGYKATDKDMKCKDFQYEVGNEYLVSHDNELIRVSTMQDGEPTKDDSLRLCSKEVIHYCNSLEDCFRWYDVEKESRYFKIGIIGRYKDNILDEKSGSVHIKFLEEISKEDIQKVVENKKIKVIEKNLGLEHVRHFQKKYHNLILGGSIALYLQGAKLKRLENSNNSDFDFISPYWIDLTEAGANYVDDKNSGNTFDETYEYKNIKIDLAVDNKTKYETVEFNGHSYKVNTIENILKYKIKYALQKNGEKHKRDIRELCIGK